MKEHLIVILILAASVFGTHVAEAGTVQSSVQVSATVVALCVATTSPVDFGSVTLAGNVSATGQIIVQCNGQVPFAITLSAGGNYDGSWRGVAFGSERRSYGLYAPNGSEWGDAGYAGTYTWGGPVTGTGTGSPQTFTVAGVLFGGGTLVTPGPYSDVVTVSLHF